MEVVDWWEWGVEVRLGVEVGSWSWSSGGSGGGSWVGLGRVESGWVYGLAFWHSLKIWP